MLHNFVIHYQNCMQLFINLIIELLQFSFEYISKDVLKMTKTSIMMFRIKKTRKETDKTMESLLVHCIFLACAML